MLLDDLKKDYKSVSALTNAVVELIHPDTLTDVVTSLQTHPDFDATASSDQDVIRAQNSITSTSASRA